MNRTVLALVLSAAAGSAMAGLTTTHTGNGQSPNANVNGVLGSNEYGSGNSFVYTGGGGGFGGTLGNGQIYMNSDAGSLYIAVNAAGNVNDNIVIFMNTRAGGFTDSTQMDDSSDPGRGRSSDPMSAGRVNFPIGVTHSFVIGGFGAVLFELQGNGTAHTFKYYTGQFTGNAAGVREFALNLNDLGGVLNGVGRSYVDWFAVYTSDSGFMSNESVPANGYNGSANPGFDNGGAAITIENYNRFQIPTPGTLALLGLGGLAAARRRR